MARLTSTRNRIALSILGLAILAVSLWFSTFVHMLLWSFVLLVAIVTLIVLLPSVRRSRAHMQSSVAASMVFFSLAGTLVLWYLFRNFLQLATGTMPGVYNLDLAGLCMLTVSATIVSATFVSRSYEHRAEKLISAGLLLLMCSGFLLIFLAYVVTPPLSWVDLVATGVFLTIIILDVSLVALALARSSHGTVRTR